MQILPSAYQGLMQKYWNRACERGATNAQTAEDFYGFEPSDVKTTHHHRQGKGAGLWFRLHDGRVFDKDGHSDDVDPLFYDAVSH
jgi:hypothetical protein